MKILFCHRGRENLGIEYLSSVLKEQGHQTYLAEDPGLFTKDDNIFFSPFLSKIFALKKYVLNKIENINPDIICFSVYTSNYNWAKEIAKEVRSKKDIKIVFGGIHPTLVPEIVLQNKFIDFVIRGEGELALSELVKGLEEGKSYKNILNLCFKENDKILINPLRSPVDINSLPLPDKELFADIIKFSGSYLIMGSRGCPYNCNYCCESFLNKIYNNKFYRKRSINSIMDELNSAKKRYDFKKVMFYDPVFFRDINNLRELLERYKNEIKIPFKCEGHIKLFTEEVANILKNSGCYCINFGVQSLNEDIKKKYLGRNETIEEIKECFQICDEVNIRYDVDYIFGIPQEKKEYFTEVAIFFSKLRYLNRIKCHNLVYFPNLNITKIAQEEGILSNGDLERFEKGEITDFFHLDFIKDKDIKKRNNSFKFLFKILPLLPPFIVRIIIRRKLYKSFWRIPSFITILFQIAIAAKSRDLRFSIYLKYYIFRIFRNLRLKMQI